MDVNTLTQQALELLKKLIATPSISRSESKATDIIESFFQRMGYTPVRKGENLLCYGRSQESTRPNLLLNSHIDTVKPVHGWTKNPFTPIIENGSLFGLGSNDAGGALVSLIQTFCYLDSKRQPYNLLFMLSCEEEISGEGGARSMISLLPPISLAIVGEPTGMRPAIAEKGLMVLDIEVSGKSGHAARDEGINAIYRAVKVIETIKRFRFQKVSPILGSVKMTVTIIQAGTQHNVIPDICNLTVDVRSNELYTNREIFDQIQSILPEWCSVKARSFHLNSSRIDPEHSIIKKAINMGLTPYGSPTISDQSLFPFPSFKIGPGESSRSHTADEFILLAELNEAIPTYINLLDGATIEE